MTASPSVLRIVRVMACERDDLGSEDLHERLIVVGTPADVVAASGAVTCQNAGMVRAGMSFGDDNTRVTFLQTAAETGGEVHEQRVEYSPGSRFPPRHFHPDQDEFFAIESGRMLFEVDGAERGLGVGEEIRIPRGVKHRARNASAEEPAIVRWETRPALRTGEFQMLAYRLGSHAGLLDSALLAHVYRDVFRLSGPARLLVPFLGWLAGLTGRRLPPLDQ